MHNFFKKLSIEWISVGILILIATWCRFVYFPGTIVWTNDSSRDFSVAYLIAQQHIWPTTGHFNTGINGNYPPYYYYFLGCLAMINSSPAFLAGVNVVFHILCLVIYYLLGKICINKTVGLLMLATTVYSGNLIFTALYASPATWNFSLYLICLYFVISWFKNYQDWRLIVSLILGLIALQVHGAQIVLVGFTLALFLLSLMKKIIKTHRLGWGWLIWLLLTVCVAYSQLPVIRTIINSPGTGSHWSLRKLQDVIDVAKIFFVFDYNSLKLLQNIYFGLVGVVGLKFLILQTNLKKNLKLKAIFETEKNLKFNLPLWWWFCLAYVGSFELALSILSAGTLAHHQGYLYLCWLLLAFGFAEALLKTLTSQKKIIQISLIIIGLVWIKVFAVPFFSDLHSIGAYDKTRDLVNQLNLAKLPITTADVFMVDNFANNLSGTSNSTQVWWFLMTEYNRHDLDPQNSEGYFASQDLILICDRNEAKELKVNCPEQIAAVLTKRGFSTKLIQTLSYKSGFDVWYYQVIFSDSALPPHQKLIEAIKICKYSWV